VFGSGRDKFWWPSMPYLSPFMVGTLRLSKVVRQPVEWVAMVRANCRKELLWP